METYIMYVKQGREYKDEGVIEDTWYYLVPEDKYKPVAYEWSEYFYNNRRVWTLVGDYDPNYETKDEDGYTEDNDYCIELCADGVEKVLGFKLQPGQIAKVTFNKVTMELL